MLSMPRIVRPDPLRGAKRRFGSPVGSTTRRSIKRNKELANTFNSSPLPSNSTTAVIRKDEVKIGSYRANSGFNSCGAFVCYDNSRFEKLTRIFNYITAGAATDCARRAERPNFKRESWSTTKRKTSLGRTRNRALLRGLSKRTVSCAPSASDKTSGRVGCDTGSERHSGNRGNWRHSRRSVGRLRQAISKFSSTPIDVSRGHAINRMAMWARRPFAWCFLFGLSDRGFCG
jgi:hypothetical protein